MGLETVWVAGAVMLSVLTVCAAQACDCVHYAYCNGTQYESQCEFDNEVCCELSEASLPTTEASLPVIEAPGFNTCGFSGNLVDYRIVDRAGGNTSTSFGEFPWMVAVMKGSESEGQEFLCAGSIIRPNIILTAAHTLSGLKAGQLSVKAGIWNTTSVEEQTSHQDRRVSQVILHPDFDRQRVVSDVALLVLERPLVASRNVASICLPNASTALNMSSCVATGWGADNFAKSSPQAVLRKVNLPIVDRETCEARLRETPRLGASFNLHKSFICAGGGKLDTCKGDGGGPLMCASQAEPRRYVQVGITAWGIGCGEGPPGVYSSVQAALAWITGQMQALGSNT